MVTGIETAGLVLAVFPVFVQVLGAYLDATSNFRNRRALVRELKVEAILFTNTCATLLEGLVPPETVMLLLSGKGWDDRKIHSLLIDRIGVDAAGVFVESVEALSLALEKLRTKLGLDEDMKVLLRRPTHIVGWGLTGVGSLQQTSGRIDGTKSNSASNREIYLATLKRRTRTSHDWRR